MSDLNVHCDVKKGGFPLNSGPALPLPAARGRCGPFSAEVQRHAAAAAVRSEAAECRELQLLRSVYFHWPSASGIHSSRSELLLGSVRTGSVHTIPPFVRPGICAREGQTHRFLISGPDNFSSFLIIYPLPDFFFFCFWRFITGRVIPALSRRWWVLPPVFVFMRGASPSGDSTATRRCGGDQTCGQAAGRSGI